MLREIVLSFSNLAEEISNLEAENIMAQIVKNRIILTASKKNLLVKEAYSGNWSWDLVNNKIDICRRGRSILRLDDFDGSYKSFLQSIHPKARELINQSNYKQ